MRRFWAILLIAVMLVSMVTTVLAEVKYASVVGGWLRLRAAASFDAETIASYFTGTQVEILGSHGGWYHVRTPDGLTGYMYGRYLQLQASGGNDSESNAHITSHNGYGVRLRMGPGTGYRVICTYPVGTPLTVLQRGNIWSKVRIYDNTGYMMSQFIAFGSGDSGQNEPVLCYATIWSQNGYGVRLRSGPGMQYAEIGVYSVGTTVSVLQKGQTWDRIRVGSRTGWMMNDFLRYASANEVTAVTLNTLTPAVGTVMSVQAIKPSDATVEHQWLVGGKIKGYDSTYTVSAADIGKKIQLRVTGRGSYAGSVLSAVTDPVVSNLQINGVTIDNETHPDANAPVVGDTLIAQPSPLQAMVSFQWKRDGQAISGATFRGYTVNGNDVGRRITVTITGIGSFSGSMTSAATAKVQAGASVPVVDDAVLPEATVGESYDARLSAQGSGRMTWALTGGMLPEGLTLSKDGRITGVPLEKGTFSFSVTAANDTGVSQAKTFSLNVIEQPVLLPLADEQTVDNSSDAVFQEIFSEH